MDLSDSPAPVRFPKKKTLRNTSFHGALDVVDDCWFTDATKFARWMDLLGDYAGVEPFVIDGEALLQIVLDDPLLAIGRLSDPSFQILHAYYLLETLLNQFKQRAANFEIVFWHENRHLTTKTGDSPLAVTSRALARSMLFAHLLKLEFKVYVFPEENDARWKQYCYNRKPMFVMTNDGRQGDEDMNKLQAARTFLQRSFLLGILSSGISVALLRGAEYRDAKILSFVFECDRSAVAKFYADLNPFIRAARDDLTTSLLLNFDGDIGECLLQPAAEVLVQEESNNVDIFRDLLILQSLQTGVEPEIVYLFIIHSILTPTLSVEERAQPQQSLPLELQTQITELFLPRVFANATNIFASGRGGLDLDGRIFSALIYVVLRESAPLADVIGPSLYAEAQYIWAKLLGPPVDFHSFAARYASALPPPGPTSTTLVKQPVIEPYHLLPFSHPVFDKQLAAVRVETESGYAGADFPTSQQTKATTFRDTRHWHNQKSILPPHLGGSRQATPVGQRRLKSDQRFMSSLKDLAATLTGASGGILQRIVIPPVPTPKGEQRQKVSYVRTSKKTGTAPKALSKADAIRLENQHKKEAEFKAESLAWWAQQLTEVAKVALPERIKKLEDLGRNSRTMVPEIMLERKICLLDADFQTWIADEEKELSSARDRYSVSIMRKIKDLCDLKFLPESACKIMTSALTALGFYDHFRTTIPQMAPEGRRLRFSFVRLVDRKAGAPLHPFMVVNEHPVIWQLRLFGDYMDRSMNSAYDARVAFKPDEWQRRVLDGIDENKSLLVVAPTSAGKTFISFYAMEKVLRESNDGILVYIAPTKALVSQIAAEVYARFSKSLNGKSCWAIHTRDYRVHDPMECQILVTVPEILAIMLLSPDCARLWTPRLKRIILDEIHTIGQQEGGSIWEQIILLAPCPLIGLSATIGSPEVFSNWLASVQEARGIQYEFIEHRHRYSHLRKFFCRKGVQQEFLGLDVHVDSKRAIFLHPVGLLAFGARTLPPDFSLEAGDTLTLWQQLASVEDQLVGIHDLVSLKPSSFFALTHRFLSQEDVLRYEGRLKSLLADLLQNSDPRDAATPIGQVVLSLQGMEPTAHPRPERPNAFKNDLLVLLADLHVNDQLPAILFNFDRTNCEFLAKHLVRELETAERTWRLEDANWNARLREWKAWKEREKLRERTAARKSKNKNTGDDAEDREGSSTLGASFNPTEPSSQFSFANLRSCSYSELEQDIATMGWRNIPAWAWDALRRGIAVHHAGMDKQYRSFVESLFRKGFIRVMIATGTLALGINAPTKTSVFCGDSPFLTALMYRQCAGRAGRRGFDLRGNVIFYGLSLDRTRRIGLSRLPPLTGNFPITFTLTLRMFSVLDGSDNADVAVRAVQSLLSLPQVTLSSQIGHYQLLHYIRFSIEYLRRSELLDDAGKPLNHFTLANHLYYTEPSNLALITLIRSGVIREICKQRDEQQAKKDLMIVLCNLFGRRNLSKIFGRKSNIEALSKQFPSMIVLPPLPLIARKALLDHEQQILQIFLGYALAYTNQYQESLGSDNTLPLSNLPIPEKSDGAHENSLFVTYLKENAIRPSIRSKFVATSGVGDSFRSVLELTQSSRSGLKLNSQAIPSMSHFAVGPDDGPDALEYGLNSHILDFYIHGQAPTLTRANGIRRGDIWYILQDFDLTLLAFRASLQQFMKESSFVDIPSVAAETYGLFDPAESEPHQDDAADDAGEAGSGPTTPSFVKPKNVSSADWRVYELLDSVCTEFGEKFRAMWA